MPKTPITRIRPNASTEPLALALTRHTKEEVEEWLGIKGPGTIESWLRNGRMPVAAHRALRAWNGQEPAPAPTAPGDTIFLVRVPGTNKAFVERMLALLQLPYHIVL